MTAVQKAINILPRHEEPVISLKKVIKEKKEKTQCRWEHTVSSKDADLLYFSVNFLKISVTSDCW